MYLTPLMFDFFYCAIVVIYCGENITVKVRQWN